MGNILHEKVSLNAAVSGTPCIIKNEAEKEVVDFISRHISNDNSSVFEVDELLDAYRITAKNFGIIINKNPVNKYPEFNGYFLSVNEGLKVNGLFISCFECYESRKRKSPEIINLVEGGLADHHLNILDRNAAAYQDGLSGKGKTNKVKSLAETFGRIVYCGFEIVDFRFLGNLTWFVARKKNLPLLKQDPAFRWIIRLNRVGKNGQMFGMYKIRTMYPYSEFIQDYIVKINGLNPLGKPDKDFRLMPVGRLIRKIWIDELPQIINLLKGDMNIMGVRPISKFLYDSYPEELRKARLKYKPGLIPPQIALREKGFAGVVKAEIRYLSEMEKGPWRTNLKYFVIAVFNILTFRVRTS